MKALCVTPERNLEPRDVPTPDTAPPDHLLLRMEASAINPGDITFLKSPARPGLVMSQHDIWGVSGVGTVLEVGDGLPRDYQGRRVTVYRSLVSSPSTVGCWSERVVIHAGACCLLPDDVDPLDYSGSLVNLITPYAFWQQARSEGHQGILVTAGTSATGIAMLGFALIHDIPVVSIVRDESGQERLTALGAKNVLVQRDAHFDEQLTHHVERAHATAVFEGVGGATITRLAPRLAMGSTLYCYGFLGGPESFSMPSALLMAKGLTITRFSNFMSPTVRDSQALAAAMGEISRVIGAPHFRTPRGRTYRFEEIGAALADDAKEGKAILVSG